MAGSPESRQGARGALWALLLLPAALAVGWLVGRIPEPPLREQPTSAAPHAAVPPGANPVSTSGAPSPSGADSPAPASEGELSSWTSLETALAESRRNGKPVLIDFSADWCGPCKRLKREVFEDGARGRAVQLAVIPVAVVDRAREYGSNPASIASLQQQYGVDAFPTLVVFSPASGRVMKTRGYGDPGETLDWITQAARSVR